MQCTSNTNENTPYYKYLPFDDSICSSSVGCSLLGKAVNDCKALWEAGDAPGPSPKVCWQVFGGVLGRVCPPGTLGAVFTSCCFGRSCPSCCSPWSHSLLVRLCYRFESLSQQPSRCQATGC